MDDIEIGSPILGGIDSTLFPHVLNPIEPIFACHDHDFTTQLLKSPKSVDGGILTMLQLQHEENDFPELPSPTKFTQFTDKPIPTLDKQQQNDDLYSPAQFRERLNTYPLLSGGQNKQVLSSNSITQDLALKDKSIKFDYYRKKICWFDKNFTFAQV